MVCTQSEIATLEEIRIPQKGRLRPEVSLVKQVLPDKSRFEEWSLTLLGFWLLFGWAPAYGDVPIAVDPGLAQPAHEASSPHETTSLNARRDSELRIQWRASVQEEGGQFLVYRGTSPESLEVFAERAPKGRSWYEVVDSPVSGVTHYELRYRDREGREHVLSTETVNVSIVEPLSPAALWHEASGHSAALVSSPALPALEARRSNVGGRVTAVIRLDEEPLTPPPERTA